VTVVIITIIPISILILCIILIFCTSALFFSFSQRVRDTREWRKEVIEPLERACVYWQHSCCPVPQAASAGATRSRNRNRNQNRCHRASSSAIPRMKRRISWVQHTRWLFTNNRRSAYKVDDLITNTDNSAEFIYSECFSKSALDEKWTLVFNEIAYRIKKSWNLGSINSQLRHIVSSSLSSSL